MNVIMLNRAMALPRSTGPQISARMLMNFRDVGRSAHIPARTPGALDNVLDANVPVKNLPTNSAAKFGANAQRKLKARYSRNVK
jgi:hypothetical protein